MGSHLALGLRVADPLAVAAGRGGGEEGRPPRQHFAGAAFEGRIFGILAFALQCVSVSLYLFLIYSVH